jgi:hypothetical protein
MAVSSIEKFLLIKRPPLVDVYIISYYNMFVNTFLSKNDIIFLKYMNYLYSAHSLQDMLAIWHI